MARKPETVFRARIKPRLEALPNTTIFSIQSKTIRGIPDFIICCRGMFVALELKKDQRSSASGLQAYNISKITLSHGLAFVVYPENFEIVYAVLSKIASNEAYDLIKNLPIKVEKEGLC